MTESKAPDSSEPQPSADRASKEERARIVFRRFDLSDLEGVFALFRQEYPDHSEESHRRREKRWKWQFTGSPLIGEAQSLVTVAELDGQIVGCAAGMPTHFRFSGDLYPAYWGSDLLLAHRFRGRGVAIRLVKHFFDQPGLTTIVKLNKPGLQVVVDLGAESLLLQAKLCRFIAGPMRLLPKLKRDKSLKVSPVEAFDERFDRLWEALQRKYIIVEPRNALVLNWRYSDESLGQYSRLGCFRDGQLSGYVIVGERTRRGRRVGSIMDIFADPEDPETLDALIEAALKHIRSSGPRLVEAIITEARLRRRFQLHGFLPILKKTPFIIYSQDRVPDPAFLDVSNWHLTLGCADLEF